jgi:hypothetical protein
MTRCRYCGQALTLHEGAQADLWVDDSGTITCHGGSPSRRHEPGEAGGGEPSDVDQG